MTSSFTCHVVWVRGVCIVMWFACVGLCSRPFGSKRASVKNGFDHKHKAKLRVQCSIQGQTEHGQEVTHHVFVRKRPRRGWLPRPNRAVVVSRFPLSLSLAVGKSGRFSPTSSTRTTLSEVGSSNALAIASSMDSSCCGGGGGRGIAWHSVMFVTPTCKQASTRSEPGTQDTKGKGTSTHTFGTSVDVLVALWRGSASSDDNQEANTGCDEPTTVAVLNDDVCKHETNVSKREADAKHHGKSAYAESGSCAQARSSEVMKIQRQGQQRVAICAQSRCKHDVSTQKQINKHTKMNLAAPYRTPLRKVLDCARSTKPSTRQYQQMLHTHTHNKQQ